MDLAWLTLLALLAVVVVSCATRANPGVVAVALAWLIAAYAAPRYGMALGEKAIAASFPAELFLMLLAVSLLFALAEANGALAIAAERAMRLAGGQRGVLPLMFFALALVLGSVGPGNIAVAGLIAPVAMAAAARTGISPLLMAVVVGHGAIGSTASPFTAAGVVANQKLAEIGLTGVTWQLFVWNAAVNTFAAFGGYLLLGGWRLWIRSNPGELNPSVHVAVSSAERTIINWQHAVTLGVIAMVILSVLVVGVHIGLAAFCGAAALMLLRVSDERSAMVRVPWSVIVMVVGVSVLTSLLEKTGGNQRFAGLMTSVSTPGTLVPIVALVTGVVSIYSSTTGVVLPAFLPMVNDIAAQSPGVEPLNLALAVLVSGNLVDVSPLSTIGALCLAAAPDEGNRRKLLQQLLAWGFAMAGVGAVISWACFR